MSMQGQHVVSDMNEPVPENLLGTCIWAVREAWSWARARLEEWRRPPARILQFRPRRFGAARRNRHLR